MKHVIIILLVISSQVTMVNGQSVTPKHTFNVELSLPASTANKPFKTIMQGLVNVAPYYQFAFKNSLAIGAGVRYTYFNINEFKVPEPVYGGMHTAGVFVKVSREKFHSERFGTDLGVKFGYTQNYITTDLNQAMGRDPIQINSTLIEPTVGLVLTADEFTSYRLVLAYAIQGFLFNPSQLGITQDGGYEPSDFEKMTQYFTVGFGFSYYFKAKN